MSINYHATGAPGDRKAAMTRRLCCLALLLLGCSSPLSEARTSFDEARYPDAVAEYRALRRQVAALPRPQLFEYALYRGLSHLALGDAQPASHWLTVAKRLWEQSPGLANAEQRGRLLSAWAAMGRMPGE
jgi:hypothetical protein